MTSVLIVDDEYLIRSLIRNSVSWEKIEMEVIGEAGDGEEALTFIKTCQPDIALVDINIPFLNGLELAHRIMEEQYRTKVILLTGYREFEYAKQAVQCRVSDYLLKPISAPELERALLRLQEEIRQDRHLHDQAIQNERQGDYGKRLMKNHFLHQLAFGRIRKSEVQIAAELERLEIALCPKELMAMVVELEPCHQESGDGIYVYAVLNVLCELLRKKEHITGVEGLSEIDNCAIVLYNVMGKEEQIRADLKEAWIELTQTMEKHFQVVLSAGVSNVFEGYGQAASAVHEAMEALSQKFYENQEKLFFAAECTISDGQATYFSGIDLEELQIRMDAGEWEGGLHLIQNLFEKMRQQRVRAEVVKMTALGLITVLHSLVSRYQFPTELLSSDGTLISKRIDQSDTCTEIEHVLVDYYCRLTEKIQTSCQISKIVYLAKAYIEEHYASEDISLKEIAATVFATPAYVSSLFKKETGNSIIEYITICRMRRAAELLHQEHDLSLTAVSEQVGYTDPYYFSRCFKKYYGVTPSKFLASRLEKPRFGSDEGNLGAGSF
ncbi:response regulator transcription factor [Pseudoflavonifractor gallinarum]|uniref:Stage 0 sporulation protein A homolog n=1 Tax=Pseudoflavonifractor hominis TaxID=2763059 RepID=A0ABR7HW19_9FIRM|nr:MULTISPECIES: response regulator [Eubacteriales]MBC5731688.1 response regulator [Pseudoflavonifractor hominis]MBS5135395.1 response regulator [Oscillospiraceae bacterium]